MFLFVFDVQCIEEEQYHLPCENSCYVSIKNFVSNSSTLMLNKKLDLDWIERIRYIALVGPSAVGKTTFSDEICKCCKFAILPTKIVTRKPRADDADKIIWVSDNEFDLKIRSKEIELAWVREMDGGRKVKYGYTREEGDIIIFPSYPVKVTGHNNYMKPIVLPERQKTLLISIYTPDDIRKKRLKSRTQSMTVEERNYRIQDSSLNYLDEADLILINENRSKEDVGAELIQFIQIIHKNCVSSR